MDHEAAKARVCESYEAYHERVNNGDHAAHVRFMNFGYESLQTAPALDRNTIAIPRLLPNAEAARLVGELIGSESVDDRAVLDVGCGRGGSLWLLARSFTPRLLVGIDLSPSAVTAALRTLSDVAVPGDVAVADAERLPIRSNSLDLVLNVESSLHYPQLEWFYGEVARVCRAGGAFCYGDLFSVAAGDAYESAVTVAGFEIEEQRDVTDNVLAARRHRAARQGKALANDRIPDGRGDEARFVGEPGTAFFSAMEDGILRYRLLRARRTTAQALHAAPDRRLSDAARLASDLTGSFASDHV